LNSKKKNEDKLVEFEKNIILYGELLRSLDSPAYFFIDFVKKLNLKKLFDINNRLPLNERIKINHIDDDPNSDLEELKNSAIFLSDFLNSTRRSKSVLNIFDKFINKYFDNINHLLCAKLLLKREFLKTEIRILREEILNFDKSLIPVLKESFEDYVDGNGVIFPWYYIQNGPIIFDHANDYLSLLMDLHSILNLEKRHGLYPTKYSLYIPKNKILTLNDPLEQIIIESTKYPSIIYNLTPREFESFIGKIFQAFGFNVELTAQTRDGGTDLICLKKDLNIPFKMAIETKKYSPDKPIGVGLVRNFVGSNVITNANKLLFVTTSSYTKDARKYANSNMLTNLLELKEFPDIIKWTNDFKEQKYKQIISLT